MKKLVVLLAVLLMFAGQSFAQTTTESAQCDVLLNIDTYCYVQISGDLVFDITGNPDNRYLSSIFFDTTHPSSSASNLQQTLPGGLSSAPTFVHLSHGLLLWGPPLHRWARFLPCEHTS